MGDRQVLIHVEEDLFIAFKAKAMIQKRSIRSLINAFMKYYVEEELDENKGPETAKADSQEAKSGL